MEERNVTVDRENGGSLATFSLVAVIVVVALIALFVWQPWNATSTTRSDGNTTATSSGTNTGTSGSPSTPANGTSRRRRNLRGQSPSGFLPRSSASSCSSTARRGCTGTFA